MAFLVTRALILSRDLVKESLLHPFWLAGLIQSEAMISRFIGWGERDVVVFLLNLPVYFTTVTSAAMFFHGFLKPCCLWNLAPFPLGWDASHTFALAEDLFSPGLSLGVSVRIESASEVEEDMETTGGGCSDDKRGELVRQRADWCPVQSERLFYFVAMTWLTSKQKMHMPEACGRRCAGAVSHGGMMVTSFTFVWFRCALFFFTPWPWLSLPGNGQSWEAGCSPYSIDANPFYALHFLYHILF